VGPEGSIKATINFNAKCRLSSSHDVVGVAGASSFVCRGLQAAREVLAWLICRVRKKLLTRNLAGRLDHPTEICNSTTRDIPGSMIDIRLRVILK